jgi:hypothetical protein
MAGADSRISLNIFRDIDTLYDSQDLELDPKSNPAQARISDDKTICSRTAIGYAAVPDPAPLSPETRSTLRLDLSIPGYADDPVSGGRKQRRNCHHTSSRRETPRFRIQIWRERATSYRDMRPKG